MSVAHLVEQVRTEASNFDPAEFLLTVLAFPLLVVGWVVGGLFRVVWTVATWMWAAAVVGFRHAKGDR